MSIMSEYQEHGKIRKVRIRKIDDDNVSFGEIIFGVLGFFMFWFMAICLLAAENYY